jgi:hypothetical protein
MNELRIPDDALRDPKAREILRVWISRDAQGFASRPDVWSDPAAWGLLLADVARQVARGYSQTHGSDPAVVLSRIRAGLDAEWKHPTDTSTDPVRVL